jgi:two-component sensor histidine kinase
VSFSAAVLVFLEKAVISRVHDLSADVLTVGTSNDLSLRVSHSGKDEIAYLGAAINGMLEALESSTGELRKIEARNAALLSAVPDMIVRVSRDGTLLDFRPAAEMPFRGISEGHIGMSLRRIHLDFPAVPAEAVEWAMGTAAASCPGEAPSVLDFSMEEDGKRRSLEARAVCGGENETVFFIRDVTAEKNLEEAQRKEIMLKEIHHRVKNNLQVISSLLDLQARASDNRHTAEVLRESRMRLHSMSIIHEKLYRSGDSSGIPVQEYVRDLVSNLRKSFAADPQAIGFRVNTEDLSLDMDVAVPCGLIINELVSNALKYAFPRGRKGEVRIGFQRGEAGRLVLEVGDDGVGLPPEVDVHSPSTLGLRIVNVLAGQLKGSLEASDDGGTTIRVSFPEP